MQKQNPVHPIISIPPVTRKRVLADARRAATSLARISACSVSGWMSLRDRDALDRRLGDSGLEVEVERWCALDEQPAQGLEERGHADDGRDRVGDADHPMKMGEVLRKDRLGGCLQALDDVVCAATRCEVSRRRSCSGMSSRERKRRRSRATPTNVPPCRRADGDETRRPHTRSRAREPRSRSRVWSLRSGIFGIGTRRDAAQAAALVVPAEPNAVDVTAGLGRNGAPHEVVLFVGGRADRRCAARLANGGALTERCGEADEEIAAAVEVRRARGRRQLVEAEGGTTHCSWG